MSKGVISDAGMAAIESQCSQADFPLSELETFIIGHPYEDDMVQVLSEVRRARRHVRAIARSAKKLT